jgi:hypothetical protein
MKQTGMILSKDFIGNTGLEETLGFAVLPPGGIGIIVVIVGCRDYNH